jgi:hypothetical protein
MMKDLNGGVTVASGGPIGAGWGVAESVCVAYAEGGAHVDVADRDFRRQG